MSLDVAMGGDTGRRGGRGIIDRMSRRAHSSSVDAIEPPVSRTAPLPMTAESRTDRWTAWILIALAFGFAISFHTLFFHRSELIGGDIRYHRGVGLTMSAGNFQGEGPIHGLLSYYGGLYPFILGWTSRILGVRFDTVVSVASWIAAPLLPMSLLSLGRSVFPGRRRLDVALLVFLGTIGSSFNTDPFARWVYSVLPSGTGEYPVFPRDIALLLLIAALSSTLRADTNRRRIFAAATAAIAISFHAQIGIYIVAILVGVEAWRLVPSRRFLALALRSGAIALIAGVGSAWWWIPRVDAAITSRHLLLANYPGTPSADVSPLGLLGALGPLGVLAVPGAWFAWRGSNRTRMFACWLLAFVPSIAASQLLGDTSVLTGRRALFFAAIPLVVCATVAASAAIHKVGVAVTVVLVIAVVVPSALEVWGTQTPISRWDYLHAGPLYGRDLWSTTETQLRDRVLRDGSAVAIAPDSDGLFVWSETGAQPYSLLLPGSVKLGFDPGPLTGTSSEVRVRRLNHAFAHGIPGLCQLARTARAGVLVLRQYQGMLGTHDLRPSSRFRVPPARRNQHTIDRDVGGGLHYFDRSSNETLTMSPNSAIPLRWDAPEVRHVGVFLNFSGPAGKPPTLVFPDVTLITPTVVNPLLLDYATPTGVPPGTQFLAAQTISVDRMIGYEPVRGVTVRGPDHGVLVVPIAPVCPPGKRAS